MRTVRKVQRRGFTLIETVVSVGIVAALAAVVYPSVVRQFDSADPTRAAEDLGNIRTGIETFGVNVRPHQPAEIEDLAIPITGSGTSAIGVTYSATSDVPNWRGPYVSLGVPAGSAASAVVATTGFGGNILNGLPLLDVTVGSLTNDGGDVVASPGVAADFLTIQVTGLSASAFDAINLLIDGPTENTLVLRRSQGSFRCPYPAGSPPAAGTACTNAYFLAVPLRH